MVPHCREGHDTEARALVARAERLAHDLDLGALAQPGKPRSELLRDEHDALHPGASSVSNEHAP
jgi:hypothetical protein